MRITASTHISIICSAAFLAQLRSRLFSGSARVSAVKRISPHNALQNIAQAARAAHSISTTEQPSFFLYETISLVFRKYLKIFYKPVIIVFAVKRKSATPQNVLRADVIFQSFGKHFFYAERLSET